jgi:hypothetical protein
MTQEQNLNEIFNNVKLLLQMQQPKETWIDNQDFCIMLKISKRTAQHYRDSGTIAFSQVGNKIYYRFSDIENLLKNNYKINSK